MEDTFGDDSPLDDIEPLSPLGAIAVQMHEMVTEYQNAGFSRAEAIQIVLSMSVAFGRPPGEAE
jgi:succinate-acetate transporter protein